MQRNGNMVGMPVGVRSGSGFDESERRMRLGRLGLAARIANDDSPWFALRCWTGREEAVDKALSRVGVSSLVPMRKGPDLRRRHRVIEGKLMPVIHGYVLVQMVSEPLFLDAFKGVEHVVEVLGGCLTPRPMSGLEVKHFKDMAATGAYDWEKPCGLILTAGETVLISGGPFHQCNAIVVTPNRKGRGDVVVSVRMLGGEVPVTIPLALLEKV